MATATRTGKTASPVRKTAAKKAAPAPKAPVKKSTARKAAAPARPARPAAPAKAEKPKKPKLVRDSFTIPKMEYTVLADLKQRAAKLGTPSKKSEVLRAGIKALAAMGDPAFAAAIAAVPAIKTGRPSKD